MPHTLLLADDSITIQRVIELTFADEDVNVIAVSDGDQAIKRLDSQPPDIVLADVGMPGKNGYEVAQYVKQSPHLSHIPVVLLTGAFEPVDQARATEAGCDGVLAKPFEPQIVIGRVKELLGGGKGSSAAEAPPADAIVPPAAAVVPAAEPHVAVDAPSTAPPAAAASDLSTYFDRLDAAFASRTEHTSPVSVVEPAITRDPAPLPVTPVPDNIDWFGAAPAAAAADVAASVVDQIVTTPPPTHELPDVPLSYASPRPEFDPPMSAVQAVDSAALVEPAGGFEVSLLPGAPPAEVVLPVEAHPESAAEVQPDVFVAPEEPPAAATEAHAEHAAAAASRESVHGDEPRRDASEIRTAPLPALADAFAALLAAEQNEGPASVAWPAPPAWDEAMVEQIEARVLDRISTRVDASVRDAVAELVSQIAERLVREEIERIKSAIR